MTDLAKLVVRLEAQTAEYQKNLEKAQHQLDKFNKHAGSTAANIGKGLVTAATAAAGAFAYMTYHAIENAEKLHELAEITGISTEGLSQLTYAAKLSGLGSEELVKGLTKLSKAAFGVANSGDVAGSAFGQLGVQVMNANGTIRPTQDLLLDIAERFSHLQDGAAKTGLAMALFGKAGAGLIPFLNQGKDGLAQMTAEANQFGLTVSGDAAAAADVFHDNLVRVKAAQEGMANQLAQQLLPMLSAMSEQFVSAAKNSGALSIGIQFVAGVFKTVVTAGIIVTSVFQQLGQIMYGVAAALLRLRKGQFSFAAEELSSAFANARNNVVGDMETIAAIWSDKVPAVAEASKKVEDEVEENIIFNPAKAGKLAADAAAKAVEAMKSMAVSLREQVATFGMTEAAVLRYKIANGELADTIKAGGPAAAAYGDEVVALQEKLDALTASSDAAKKKQEEWQGAIDAGKEITTSVQTPLDEYHARVEYLNDALQLGVITQDTYNKAIATASNAFQQASETGSDFMQQASRNVQDILAQYLEDPFSKSLGDLVVDFGKMLSQMAAQAVAADIAGKLFGTGGVGSGGGWLGQLGGIAANYLGGPMAGLGDIAVTTARLPIPTGGGMAQGGDVHAGRAYRVGDQGKAEWFVPQSRGKIQGASDSKVMSVNQTFSIQAPTGTVSRRTEQQVAAAAARGLAQANRRNN